jgi:hypothetical protein
MANEQEFGETLVQTDVAELVDEFQQRIKSEGEWSDFYASSTGQTLIENAMYFLAQHNYKWLRGIQESFPTKASQRESVIEGFKMLNYDPDRRIASNVDLRFYLNNPHAVDIVIPRFTVVEHTSGLSFITTTKGIIQQGETEVTIPTMQGTLNTKTVRSQGNEDMSIYVPSTTVAEDGLFVFENSRSNEWNEIDSLIRALQSEGLFESYAVDSRTDETLDVLFGDGFQGKIPPSGADMEVVYIETQGPDGTVFGSDSITNLVSTVDDVGGNDVTDIINVTNDSRSATGGESRQSIQDIKISAPQVFSTGGRAVTRSDYQAIAEEYDSVVRANAVGERHADPPNPDYSDVAEIYVIRERNQNNIPQPVTDSWAFGTSDDASIANPDPETFLHHMGEKSDIDTTNKVFDAEQVWFFVDSVVGVDASVTPSEIINSIETELDDFLLESNNPDRTIGDAVRESHVSELVDSFSDVDYSHINLVEFARDNIASQSVTFRQDEFEASNVDYSLRPPFQKEEIKVFDVQGNQIAHDDGDRTLVADGSLFDTGRVNYLDPDPQTLQSDASSGSNISVDVKDASVFFVDDTVRIYDDANSEEATVDSVDEGADTITVDLSNSYTTGRNAKVDKIWEIDLNFTQTPNQIIEVQAQVKDPRVGRTEKDGDILVNNDQFAIYRPSRTKISTEISELAG